MKQIPVPQRRQPLQQMNFHDDASAVIARLNRVSVWRDAGDGETPCRVVHVRTKYADPRYL
jgi:hypothetical protein